MQAILVLEFQGYDRDQLEAKRSLQRIHNPEWKMELCIEE